MLSFMEKRRKFRFRDGLLQLLVTLYDHLKDPTLDEIPNTLLLLLVGQAALKALERDVVKLVFTTVNIAVQYHFPEHMPLPLLFVDVRILLCKQTAESILWDFRHNALRQTFKKASFQDRRKVHLTKPRSSCQTLKQ